MRNWLVTMAVMLCLSGSAIAFWQQDRIPGEQPVVRESYSAEELEQQQSQIRSTAPVGAVPAETERKDGVSIEDDAAGAASLSNSVNPTSVTEVNGREALATAERDLQTKKGKPWWMFAMVGTLFLGIGVGGFMAFTRWTARLTSEPLFETVPLPAQTRARSSKRRQID